MVGKVTVGIAIAFVSIYVLYASLVAANEILRKHSRRLKLDYVTHLLPMHGSVFSPSVEEDTPMYSPLLELDTEEGPPRLHDSLPQWMWATNVAIYSNHFAKAGGMMKKGLHGDGLKMVEKLKVRYVLKLHLCWKLH
ncbi:unnamed protein product [Arabis nemorensis]|uniref:Uncharacterized protein n=1 Tax=Arabis nemorensis TaxID=586526 RepID=A0A565BHE5_9BRAS|nr:unnamed protein product [Arabis nemorensis]